MNAINGKQTRMESVLHVYMVLTLHFCDEVLLVTGYIGYCRIDLQTTNRRSYLPYQVVAISVMTSSIAIVPV